MRSFVALLIAAVVATGCASGGEPEPSAAGTAVDGVVSMVGNDQLAFNPSEISADTGDLTIELTCEGSAPHTIVIVATDDLVAECTGGNTGTGEVSLEPGSYDFFCSIPGHRRAGMAGTLTVSG